MLEPNERHLLADALRPPPGYHFDLAITTTFTLDLLTLLTMPVAFTLHNWATNDGLTKLDPLTLLEAVRRYAQRIHVFCQAGRIAIPRHGQLLFDYLERSVIEVTAPNGGAFHPKMTVLRYTPDLAATTESEKEGLSKSVRYRVLCASRNLTFDRSWDTLLILEGGLDIDRVRAFGRNRPLHDFVAALPTMAVRPINAETKANIDQMADELLRVRFEPPEGFDELSFHPIGVDNRVTPPFGTRSDRILVMSPFVDHRFLDRLAGQTEELHLVSRVETMDALPRDSLDRCSSAFVLNDSAQSLESQSDPADASPSQPIAGPAHPEEDTIEIEPSDVPLRGLHAKLFIVDAGRTSKIWTGSANATMAAFERNVEFLIELTGRASQHGVRALLKESDDAEGRDRHVGFRDLLVPYRHAEDAIAGDPVAKKLEDLIDQARKLIVEAHLTAKVHPHEVAGKQCYDLAIWAASAPPVLPPEVTSLVRPISLPGEGALPLAGMDHEPIVEFRNLSFEALTGFLAVEMTATWHGQKQTTGFVLNLPLIGAPADRESRLLLALLDNRQRVLRYLLMLLADVDLDPREILGEGHTGASEDNSHPYETSFGLPLLEWLMRALDKDPHRLEQVARLVDDLRRSEKGQEIVPPEFLAIWEPIWSASKERIDAKV